MAKLRAGFIINPVAGLGGSVALKGTDGVAALALAKGAVPLAGERASVFLDSLGEQVGELEWVTCAGAMGAEALGSYVDDFTLVGKPAAKTSSENTRKPAPETSSQDTRRAAAEMEALGIDLLLFVGGDGTARDLVDVLAATPAVLGIPAGVKMQSGVFASSPVAAAKLVAKLLRGEVLSQVKGEVRDLDEDALRQGKVLSEYYGELPVPGDLRYLQHTKVGGRESEPLVVEEIAAQVRELADDQTLLLMGAGTTVAGVMTSLGLPNTLMGIDAVQGGELIASDLTEQDIWALLQSTNTHSAGSQPAGSQSAGSQPADSQSTDNQSAGSQPTDNQSAGSQPTNQSADSEPTNNQSTTSAQLFLSFTGGQGYLFGRGNQQVSQRCIRKLGRDSIHILATRTKLAELEGRPLLVDTGERSLDEALAGLVSIITGFEDEVYYRIAAA